MGPRQRQGRGRSKTHALPMILLSFLGFLLIAGVAFGIGMIGNVNRWLSDLPDYTDANAYLVSEPTDIVDCNGNTIASFYTQNRKSITKDQVSPYVLQGTIDVEDERFYEHGGIDLWGIARASVATLTGGHEGASTITQQLVRNTILQEEQFDSTIERKVREAYIAIKMEDMYSKDDILMMYLNTIYYGHGAYGIEAAAEGRELHQLQQRTLTDQGRGPVQAGVVAPLVHHAQRIAQHAQMGHAVLAAHGRAQRRDVIRQAVMHGRVRMVGTAAQHDAQPPLTFHLRQVAFALGPQFGTVGLLLGTGRMGRLPQFQLGQAPPFEQAVHQGVQKLQRDEGRVQMRAQLPHLVGVQADDLGIAGDHGAVVAPHRCILPFTRQTGEEDLPHALAHQTGHLVDNLLEGATFFATAHVRHDAIGAEIIAPNGDRKPC